MVARVKELINYFGDQTFQLTNPPQTFPSQIRRFLSHKFSLFFKKHPSLAFLSSYLAFSPQKYRLKTFSQCIEEMYVRGGERLVTNILLLCRYSLLKDACEIYEPA